MKNQIILVSRIYQRDEFELYSDDKNSNPISVKNENTKVVILQGFSFFKNEPKSDEEFDKWGKDEAVKILKLAEEKGFKKDHRTVIAYHDRTPREDEFKLAIKQEKWSAIENIAEYGSRGKAVNDNPLYRDILVPLGDAIKNKKDTAKLIDALRQFFFDIILKEKLTLLQSAINGEFTGKTVKLSEPIQEFQSDFDKFAAVEEVKNGDVFSANGKYQDAYATLREAFDI